MRKPVADLDIHIVGEAYSYGQGWVEGALDTAESMLQDFFGLKRPHWLDAQGLRADAEPVPRLRRPLDGCDRSARTAARRLDSVTPSCLRAVRGGLR